MIAIAQSAEKIYFFIIYFFTLIKSCDILFFWCKGSELFLNSKGRNHIVNRLFPILIMPPKPTNATENMIKAGNEGFLHLPLPAVCICLPRGRSLLSASYSSLSDRSLLCNGGCLSRFFSLRFCFLTYDFHQFHLEDECGVRRNLTGFTLSVSQFLRDI